MNERPAWFVIIVLLMLAGLMGVHLLTLWVSVQECDEYAKILFEQARRLAQIQTDQVVIKAVNTECNNIEDDFASASAQYLGMLLALLGGSAIANKQNR